MRSLRSRAAVLGAAALLALGATACGGGDTGSDTPTDVEADVEVTGTDSLKFDPTELEAEAGEVTIALTAGSSVNHDLVVQVDGTDVDVVATAKNSTNVGTVELEPGTYTFFCSVPGHRTAGMEGTITVE